MSPVFNTRKELQIKTLLIFITTISIIPVSIMTMMWGWGLEAHNVGWISFGYLWMFVPALISLALKE